LDLPVWVSAVIIPLGIGVCFAGILLLVYSLFARISGWTVLAKRYGVVTEPEGRKLTRQTIKIGPVRWRGCVTVIISQGGLFLALRNSKVKTLLSRHPPLFIPWKELKDPRPGWLHTGGEATLVSVGFPEIETLTLPSGLYKEIVGFLQPSRKSE
jgi:hypothetical protein